MNESTRDKVDRVRGFLIELIGDRKMSKKDAVAHLVKHGHDERFVALLADDIAAAFRRRTRLKGIGIVLLGLGLILTGLVVTFVLRRFSDSGSPAVLLYGPLVSGLMCCVYGTFMILVGKEADDLSGEQDDTPFLDSI